MRRTLGVLTLLIATVAVYANSLQGPFVLDGFKAIVENESLRDLLNLGEVLAPPANTTVAGRPVLNLSFALNYAMGGLDVVGYHVGNLCIHLLATLALFGFLSRALTRHGSPTRLGFAIALLWALHPLQTQAVTYMVQRAESLMGLFYCATLYFAARGLDTNRKGWFVLAVLTCALGMGSKEVMVSAPILVLLYDRCFVAGGFGAAVRERWALYLGLAATWIPLGLAVSSDPRGNSVGFGFVEVSAFDYLLTQSEVLWHYVSSSLWPRRLVFDYDWPVAHDLSQVLWAGLAWLFVLLGCVVALWRNSWLGFAGAFFFLVLAPTSSLLPIVTEIAAEQRMYLPLVVPLALVVIAVHAGLRRSGLRERAQVGVGCLLLVLAATTLGRLTWMRNQVYASEVTLWEDTTEKQPNNGRAHNSLAVHFLREGRFEEALRSGQRALEAGNVKPDVYYNLGLVYLSLERHAEAAQHLEVVLQTDPSDANAHANLGFALAGQGRFSEAEAHLTRGVTASPDNAAIQGKLGEVLARLGRQDRALYHLERALDLEPRVAHRHYRMGVELELAGRRADAVRYHEEALRLDPTSVACGRLSWILTTTEDPGLRDAERGLKLIESRLENESQPSYRQLYILSAALGANGRYEEAIRAAERAVEMAKSLGLAPMAQQMQASVERYFRNSKPIEVGPSGMPR